MNEKIVIPKEPHNFGADLLRIVAMLMIVTHHFSLHSGIICPEGSADAAVMSVMELGGKTGVNIFVLITGYYSSGKIRREKILDLIITATVYSLVLTGFADVKGSVGISKKLLVKAAFPLLFGDTYWFIVTYLQLYILIPMLNRVIVGLDEKMYGRYLLCFTFLFCIFPSIFGKLIFVNDLGYSPLVWFVYIYCLGNYLRKTNAATKFGKKIYIYIYIVAFVQIAACIGLSHGSVQGVLRLVLECLADCSANAVVPLILSVLMLLTFQRLEINRGKNLIRKMGAATLGVYLFHDNVNFRVWLWQTVYRLVSDIGLGWFVINATMSVLMVFLLGCAIEVCRKTLAGHICMLFKVK